MALIKSISEFEKYVRTAGALNFETIKSAIPEAQDKYLRDILGDDLLSDIDLWHNLDDEVKPSVEAYEAILPYIQRAIARFTLVICSAEIDVHLTDSGIAVISNQNLAPASSDRVKKFNDENERRGWDSIETLLRFLEANKTDYPEWVSSTAYTLAIRNLVNSAEEFDRIININKSRLYFSRVRNLLDDADNLHIKKAISAELFAVIISQLKSGTITDAINTILPDLKRAEVFYAAIDSLDRSKYDGVGVQVNLQFMQRDIDNYKLKAEQYLGMVREVLDLNPDNYPEYRDSDQYVGVNTDGVTDYSLFDNTDEENHIFVM